MKKIIMLVCFASGFVVAEAQQTQYEIYTTVRGSGPELGYSVIINGDRISGTFNLFNDWRKGTVTLKNGSVYNDMLLKYDTYHQVLMFMKGTDSLEVADPIKEFTITKIANVQMKFFNADLYREDSKPLFFEVLVNGPKGQLLKAYRKKLTSFSAGLVETRQNKYLNPISEYFWYNVTNDKIFSIRQGGGNIKSVLKLSNEEANSLNYPSYDFNSQDEIITFFKNYEDR